MIAYFGYFSLLLPNSVKKRKELLTFILILFVFIHSHNEIVRFLYFVFWVRISNVVNLRLFFVDFRRYDSTKGMSYKDGHLYKVYWKSTRNSDEGDIFVSKLLIKDFFLETFTPAPTREHADCINGMFCNFKLVLVMLQKSRMWPVFCTVNTWSVVGKSCQIFCHGIIFPSSGW